MTQNRMKTIVLDLAKALEQRDYEKFVSHFSDDAVFEIPFTVESGISFTGLPRIKEHFNEITKSPLASLIQIISVNAKSYIGNEEKTMTIEYFMEGKTIKTNEYFTIQSSIALVTFNESHIVHYKDFPNTIGIAKKAGVLQQLASAWIK